MDTGVGNSSAIPVTPVVTSPGITKKSWDIHSFFSVIANAIISGIVLGVVGAIGWVWIPVNRVVVYNQPYASYLKISSVYLTKPGFVVLYNYSDVGISVEKAQYLLPGFHKNLMVQTDISNDILRAPGTIPMAIRLFLDDGDRLFDDSKDTPVKNLFGQLMNERFWMTYNFKPSFVRYMDQFVHLPVMAIGSFLFP